MRAELDKYLVVKYPKIFEYRYASIQESCMAFGFEHEDGWFWLLDQLCDSIQSYIDYNSKRVVIKNKILRKLELSLRRISYKSYSNIKIIKSFLYYRGKVAYKIADYIDSKSKKIEIETISQVVATQVKEKFGILNFNYQGGDDYTAGMISLAEKMSQNICEFCGATEHVGRTKGWIYTICKDCYDANTRASVYKWKENQLPLNLTRKIKLEILK